MRVQALQPENPRVLFILRTSRSSKLGPRTQPAKIAGSSFPIHAVLHGQVARMPPEHRLRLYRGSGGVWVQGRSCRFFTRNLCTKLVHLKDLRASSSLCLGPQAVRVHGRADGGLRQAYGFDAEGLGFRV